MLLSDFRTGETLLPTAKSLLGHRAETMAANHLQRMGYRQATRNYRSRYGEIDIIAWDGDCLVFVEVRSHRTTDFGTPAESIGIRKQTRLFLTAQIYIEEQQLHDTDCRFDVFEVIFAKGVLPRLEVIKAAFEAPENAWS
jgi:putative endonuclease